MLFDESQDTYWRRALHRICKSYNAFRILAPRVTLEELSRDAKCLGPHGAVVALGERALRRCAVSSVIRTLGSTCERGVCEEARYEEDGRRTSALAMLTP